jgi:hypothetical protein
MKKLALIALLLCVGVVAGCSENKTGGSAGSAAPAATGSAS